MSELPARPVIGILHPGVMGASVGSALKPVAGAVIWAAAGRSVTTSKRAEIADLVGVPDLRRAGPALRRDHLGVPARRRAGRRRAGGRRGGGDRREQSARSTSTPTPSRRRPCGDIGERLGRSTVSSTGRSSARPAGNPATPCCGSQGRRHLWWPRFCSPAPRSPRGVLDGGLGAASGAQGLLALQSKALPMICGWRWPRRPVRLRGEGRAAGRGGAHRGRPRRHSPGRGERAAGKAWRWVGEMEQAGDALSGVGVPDGFSRAAAEMYRRMAAADTVDRANLWGLRGRQS